MATNDTDIPDYDKTGDSEEVKVKIICLGDSAVGKSKLVERFLMNGYKPQQLSTYALTLFNHKTEVNGKEVSVDFWDTAGQERFNNMHPSYYHQAHACILVFDTTRKVTYKNLPEWLKELRDYRPEIPCLCVGNKIDVDMSVTKKGFNFAKKHNMPFYFVSASDGTNVVKVNDEGVRTCSETLCIANNKEVDIHNIFDLPKECLKLFKDSIRAAVDYKNNSTDFMDEVMRELENFELDNGKIKDDKDDSVSDSGLDTDKEEGKKTS